MQNLHKGNNKNKDTNKTMFLNLNSVILNRAQIITTVSKKIRLNL